MSVGALFAEYALLPSGWARNVTLHWTNGVFDRVEANTVPPSDAHWTPGPVIPGLPNLHSHAFQRGFAGLTEYRSSAADSFWSWRDLMYRFASALTPEHLEAIAFWLYVEMLEAGFTSVCEFHYVHHQPDGRPYADAATLSRSLLRAAARAGIGMTLLPVLYQTGGFGGQQAGQGQRRFLTATDTMLTLVQTLRADVGGTDVRIGLAPHSLRAVPPASLAEAVAGLHALDATAPVHIHIAEQTKEVEDCVAWSGQRPVQWLLDHADVDRRWCLIHATHMAPDEYRCAVASGAVAGLCPSTEANLGDGLFDLPQWRSHGGAWGVGSDSNTVVNAAEELMLLEYGQRLRLRARNVLATEAQPHVATAVLLQAVAGGAQAAARPVGGLGVGQRADCVVLDADHMALAGLTAEDMLSAHLFASNRGSAIASVWASGTECVHGRHTLHAEAVAGFIAARAGLLAG